jgi:carbon-monoxide dehydrogenase large subunit
MIAAYLLEVHDDDVEWDVDRFVVKGAPEAFKTMKEIAFAAYNQAIPGNRAGSGGGQLLRPAEHDLSVRRLCLRHGYRRRHRRLQTSAQFYALDDCGTRINPMIIEGQVHGGLTEALAIAMGQEIAYDEHGQCEDRHADGLLPARPRWETPNYRPTTR